MKEGKNQKQKEEKMRKEMCEVKDKRTAKKRMPWASRIVKVVGGYMGFESVADFKIWNNQK